MDLIRMSAAGNAFYFVLDRTADASAASLARSVCAGWTGADGAPAPPSDGLIFGDAHPPAQRMFNPDGSEGMCANGLRCLAHLLHGRGALPAEGTIRTLDGPKRVRISGDEVEAVMGRARPLPALNAPLSEPLTVVAGGEEITGFGVFFGNPHFVVFGDAALQARVAELGPLLQDVAPFSDGVNVELAVRRDDGVAVRVWERGVGETPSCGTGAVAVAAAAGIAAGDVLRLAYPGGTLRVARDADGAYRLAGRVVVEGTFAFSKQDRPSVTGGGSGGRL